MPADTTPADPDNRVYLGDSVYARFDGYNIWLEVNNGMGYRNPIAIDFEVYAALRNYAKGVFGETRD